MAAECGGDEKTWRMTRPRPLPTELSNRPFSVEEARAHGVTPGRLRGNDLTRPFRGVRLGPASWRELEECHSYAAKMRPSDYFSHATAARIHGLPLPWRLQSGSVHVTAVLPAGRPRGRGVSGHAVERALARVVVVQGLRVSHPVEAWCELAASLTLTELVAVGDALVCRQRPLATMDDLMDAVGRRSGRRGCAALRAALEHIRPRTDSWEETMLRLDLAAAGLPEPEVNGVICDENGAFVAYGDLVYRRYKVVVEYDGEQHRTDGAQYQRDIERLDELARLGWRVVRFTRLHRGATRREWIGRVIAALTSRGWR